MLQKIVITTLLVLGTLTIQVREIVGITLPEQIVREMDRAELVLNGASIREQFSLTST